MLEPDFSGAFTNDCCNRNADCKMSGGWWIFHPSVERYTKILDLISKPVPGTANEGWTFGDMQVVLYLFAKITEKSGWREWPFSRDMRQGMVPGIRILPAFQNLTDWTMEIEMTQNGRRNRGLPPEGVLSYERAEAEARGLPVWNMLDPRYDGLVGNCECVPERDLGAGYFTVHYTCLPVTPPVHKPGRYENEEEFLTHVRTRMFSCLRYFYLRWYDAFARGMESRLAEPYYTGPEIRVVDAEADRETARNRQMAFEEAVSGGAPPGRETGGGGLPRTQRALAPTPHALSPALPRKHNTTLHTRPAGGGGEEEARGPIEDGVGQVGSSLLGVLWNFF
jgi:hypothetical protein